MTCRPGTPADSFLCHVANMSADMSATRWPDRHMSIILTLVLTHRHPTFPAKLEMPKRLEIPILGTATQQLIESDATASVDEEQFRKEADKLQKQREARGKGSIFSVMQPLYCPELDELINKRIDVLYSFLLGSGEKVLQWCQGKVIEVLTEKAKPTVVVHWDPMPMPNVEGKENLSDETQQVLPPRMWNKDVEGAWRIDTNVEIVEDAEEHESICHDGPYLNVNSNGRGSELETDHDSEVETDSDSNSD